MRSIHRDCHRSTKQFRGLQFSLAGSWWLFADTNGGLHPRTQVSLLECQQSELNS